MWGSCPFYRPGATVAVVAVSGVKLMCSERPWGHWHFVWETNLHHTKQALPTREISALFSFPTLESPAAHSARKTDTTTALNVPTHTCIGGATVGGSASATFRPFPRASPLPAEARVAGPPAFAGRAHPLVEHYGTFLVRFVRQLDCSMFRMPLNNRM